MTFTSFRRGQQFIQFMNTLMKAGEMINPMKEILVSVSDELYQAIECERDSRKLRTVSEMVRVILAEFFRDKID